jgi:integrase
MASAKIVLRTKKSKTNNMYPLAVRITKDRKATFIYTGQYINSSDWDEKLQRVKKSHPNSTRLNNLLIKKLAEANDKLIQIESEVKPISQHAIKQKFKRAVKKMTVIKVLDLYISKLEKEKKYAQIPAEKSKVNNVKTFFGDQEIFMEDINEALVDRFSLYMKYTKEVGERTIVNHLIMLRTIFNLAINEGIVDAKYYPFGKGKIVIKFPESSKIGLNEVEVRLLEKLPVDPTNPKFHAKNVWLFAFYFAGMRVSDVLQIKWSDIIDGRLVYKMGKNKKTLSLVIPKKAQAILKAYNSQKSENRSLVFPELNDCDLSDLRRARIRINTSNRKFNKHLLKLAADLGIKKKLSMHIARHTFGNLSGDKIPIQMLQRLYRHSSITTTINYQGNFIHKDADDALESVVDF